jgi:uncharacterized OB-fold protein
VSDAESFKLEDWTKGIRMHAGPISLGIYQPSPETAEYWRGIERRELWLRYCPHCDRAFHPKRIICSDCGADDLIWRRSEGQGQVYSFSEIHRPPNATFAASAPYIDGLVRLAEGVHLFTRFIADPGPVAIDAPARLDFRVLESGYLLPVFLVG